MKIGKWLDIKRGLLSRNAQLVIDDTEKQIVHARILAQIELVDQIKSKIYDGVIEQ